MWNGTPTQSGSSVSVVNVNYNGSIPVAGAQSFGFLATWNNTTNAIPTLTCTAA
jgi:hypothetical protein